MEKTMKRTLIALLIAAPAWGDAGPDGGAIYKANCAMCHGPDGKGQTPVGKSLN